MTTTPPTAPILDPSVAVDHLLDARGALLAVQRSSLPGAPLYEAMGVALTGTDEALRLVRALAKAKAA